MALSSAPSGGIAAPGASSEKLTRSMSLTNLIFLGVSAQIGSGWLFAVLSAAGAAGPAAIVSWVLAALLFGVIAMPWMELGAMLPRSGGPVRYPSLSHGMMTGWLVGGAYWIATVAVTTLEAQAVLTYVSSNWPQLGLMHEVDGLEILTWPRGILAGVAILAVFTVLNIFGIKMLSEANRWITLWKIAIPTLTFILLFTAFRSSNFTETGFFAMGFDGVLHAIPATGIAFAYLGFRQVLDFGGECKNPQRNIPIAIAASILIPMVVYVLLQVAFIGALDWAAAGLAPGEWGSLLSSDWASAPLFQALIAAGFGGFGTLLLIDAIVSPAATGWVFLGSATRSTYALSEHDMAPSLLQRLNRFAVPWISLIVSFAVSCLFLLPLPSWYRLVSIVSVALLLSYLVGSSSMMVLRRTAPDLPRPFRLRNAGFWAPASFVATLILVYVAGFSTVLNLSIVVFAGTPAYVAYIAVRQNWITRIRAYSWSAVFLTVWGFVSWQGGWFMTVSGGQREGAWDTPAYLMACTAVLAVGGIVLYLMSNTVGRVHVSRSTWFVALLMAVLFLSFYGSYGPLDHPVFGEGWDLIPVAIAGLAGYYWSVASGFETDEVRENHLEEEVVPV
ncbi:APC family permease [Rhodococcus sp. MSC1_016]|jgi:amino acid transporter|uniref:APC family permease n=1 Tax=Rhodococcus sp. MSC1_016 TaxID=2909266 RepID=UPI0020302F4E|nr:APC family permease [Rhodococcus sp. MSC1_016]